MYNAESKRIAKVKTTFEVLERGYLGVFRVYDRGARDIQKGRFFWLLFYVSVIFIGSRIARPEAFVV